jgi:hypothetical protein
MIHVSEKALPVLLQTGQVSVFFSILTKGFEMTHGECKTVHDFLAKELELSEHYIENRIQTIFLNGKAVDNIKAAELSDKDTLALSAAMPGLVGATFRRGGRYAAMRQSVSHFNNQAAAPDVTKTILLKLFNLVAKEIGPGLLARGIRIQGSDLISLLIHQPEDFWQGCNAVVDGKSAAKKTLLNSDLKNNTILLKVIPPS